MHTPRSARRIYDRSKVFVKGVQQSEKLLTIVKQFCDDIVAEFGLVICNKTSFIKAKLLATYNTYRNQ